MYVLPCGTGSCGGGGMLVFLRYAALHRRGLKQRPHDTQSYPEGEMCLPAPGDTAVCVRYGIPIILECN